MKNFDALNVPVSGLYLLAAPSTPAEVIDAVAERSEAGERLSLDKVKTMIAEHDAQIAALREKSDRKFCGKVLAGAHLANGISNQGERS